MTQRDGASLLAQWLARSGRRQREVAEQLGVSESTVSLLLSGDRTPSLELAVKLSDVTGIPPKAWIAR